MSGKVAYTSIYVACLLATGQALAQQPPLSAETAPSSSQQADAPAVTKGSPADNTATDAELDSLLAPSTDLSSMSQPASPSAETAPSASSKAEASAATTRSSIDNVPANENENSPLASPAGVAKDSGSTYVPIPVLVESDNSKAPQTATNTPPTPAQLDEIVVTATKRPELVRDIPASISVLTGKKLEEMGAHELKDFIRSVPGLNKQDDIANSNMKLSIRGVGPDNGTNQTVGIVYGDVALSDPYGSYTIADPDPWDLHTVEVLKGPQGTLFGATSLAGLIRYVPNSPELGNWGGLLSADWTHVDQGGTEPSFGVVLNAPIGDTVALRFAGSWQHKPGVLDVDNPSYKKVNADDGYTRTGRIMALWQPTDKFTLNAWYIKGQRNAGELGFLTSSNGQFMRDDTPAPSPVSNGYSLATLDARYAFDWATLV
ncbi:MAG: TonB-dependent receptor plug domain-containing protein, partial [Stenotrophobium sp.]